jgi:hypothetical protein
MTDQGTDTWDQALTLAASGWTGADERINALGSALTDHVASLIERPTWQLDVIGDSLDIGLALSGDPEHWRSLAWETVEGHGRRIFRVIVPTGAMATVGTEAYLWAGAAACAAVQAIELAGHGAEVWAYNAADDGCERLGVRVLLKPAEYPLDMPRLAFVAANAAFHRRLCWRFRETAPAQFSRGFTDGYGRTSYHYLTEQGQANDIVLPTPMAVHGFIGAGGAQEALMKWLKTRLAQAGIINDPDGSAPAPVTCGGFTPTLPPEPTPVPYVAPVRRRRRRSRY